ncbi:hypothetical protein BC941DRAFT_512217 [Chlamydoabsidia padenii]|nr:hypothetical protein BC941DRAFT_512217 [Chlamydoabsidia padenii]
MNNCFDYTTRVRCPDLLLLAVDSYDNDDFTAIRMKHVWLQQKEKDILFPSNYKVFYSNKNVITATTAYPLIAFVFNIGNASSWPLLQKGLKQRGPHTTVTIYQNATYNNNDHHQQRQPGFIRHCLSGQSSTFTTTEYTPH